MLTPFRPALARVAAALARYAAGPRSTPVRDLGLTKPKVPPALQAQVDAMTLREFVAAHPDDPPPDADRFPFKTFGIPISAEVAHAAAIMFPPPTLERSPLYGSAAPPPIRPLMSPTFGARLSFPAAPPAAASGAQSAPPHAPTTMPDIGTSIEQEISALSSVYALLPRIIAIIAAARAVNGLAGWLAIVMRAPQAVAAVVPLVEQMMGITPPA